MREIRVLVRLQVDECEPDAKIDLEAMQDAAVDAVENAVAAPRTTASRTHGPTFFPSALLMPCFTRKTRKTWTKTNVVLPPVSRRPAR